MAAALPVSAQAVQSLMAALPILPVKPSLPATRVRLATVAAKAGLTGETGAGHSTSSALRAGTIHSTVDFIPARLCQIWALALLTSASLPKFISPNRAFRPGF